MSQLNTTQLFQAFNPYEARWDIEYQLNITSLSRPKIGAYVFWYHFNPWKDGDVIYQTVDVQNVSTEISYLSIIFEQTGMSTQYMYIPRTECSV